MEKQTGHLFESPSKKHLYFDYNKTHILSWGQTRIKKKQKKNGVKIKELKLFVDGVKIKELKLFVDVMYIYNTIL